LGIRLGDWLGKARNFGYHENSREDCTRVGRQVVLGAAAIGVCIALGGCSRAKSEAPAAPPRIPHDRTFNDAARFLAGLPGEAGSPYGELEKHEAWQTYAKDFDTAFKRSDDRLLRPVREFSARELKGAATGGFVYYPFAGPDVLYVQSFYPDAKRYLLCGLERPGSILTPASYKTETLGSQLMGIRQGSASLLHRSFFITNEMSQQFRGQLMDGLLPVALMLMARSGNTIDNMRYLILDESGKAVEISKTEEKRGERPDGFEIVFRRSGEQEQRTLTYLRLDMGFALKEDSAFLKYLHGQERPNVLLKSASFLLHSKNFAVMRNYLLKNADLIVQDDSGIPYYRYREHNWTVDLYGQYQRPGAPFTSRLLQDLLDAYGVPGRVKEKKFSMGYGTGQRPTTLLIARHPAR
jgi:hypothetical protein